MKAQVNVLGEGRISERGMSLPWVHAREGRFPVCEAAIIIRDAWLYFLYSKRLFFIQGG